MFQKIRVFTRLFYKLYILFGFFIFIIFLFTKSTKMNDLTVTGVDLGSSATKIAAVLKGGVQIITNEANFRQTPNIVGFLDSQRLIGQAGQVKLKTNHSNSVIAPSRYLGFNKQSLYLNQELKFCPAKTNRADQNESLKFNVSYCSNKQSFYPEQLVAAYITELEKIISQTNNLVNKNMVIAVPSYFTQHERKALFNAMEITSKKTNTYQTQLVDEEVAVSMDYGFPRRKQFSEDWKKSKNVLFIDFGHSKTNLFVTAFNKNHMRIIANKFDRQLGCKFMDEQLLNFYASKFDQTHPHLDLNLLQSKKATLKLLDNIQKQRKVLSGIHQHDLNIECLLEEQDFNYSMKRQEYDKICAPVIQKFKNFLVEFLNQMKEKQIKFDLIELIGGGTRIPVIINTINQVFKMQASRTINSNQCIAKGAALISAMNSSIFKVNQNDYFNVNSYPINIRVDNYLLKMALVDKNELILKQKLFEFEVDANEHNKFVITAEYDDNMVEIGLEKRLFSCQVEVKSFSGNVAQSQIENEMKQEAQQNSNRIKLMLKIKLNESGLYDLEGITSKNNQLTVLVTNINTFEKFTNIHLQEMQQKQRLMALKDLKIKKFYEKKNQFESFIYKCRERVSDFITQNKQYISQEHINQMQNQLSFEEQQLYDNSQIMVNLNSDEFVKKSQLLNQKIQNMIGQVNKIKQIHMQFNNELLKLGNFINEIINKRGEGMHPEQVNKAGQWINSIMQSYRQQPKSILPTVKVEEIRQVMNNLTQKIHEFDNEMQRQRIASQRGQRKQHQYQRQPQSYLRHEEPRYQQPYRSPYDYGVYEPRTTRNRGRHSNNPFGFFGSGFSSFF